MKNKIEELENTIEQLTIQSAMNLAHIKALEMGIAELSKHLLNDSETKTFLNGVFDTLFQKTDALLHSLDVKSPGNIQKQLYEVKSYIELRKKELQNLS